jgi:hypothetical protein
LIFRSNSQIAAAALLNFKGLKQRFEIAFAKALTSAAANDFKEHGGAVWTSPDLVDIKSCTRANVRPRPKGPCVYGEYSGQYVKFF